MQRKDELSLTGRSVTSLEDLSASEIVGLMHLADDMAKAIGLGTDHEPEGSPGFLDRILGLLFFEPSTRTRLSFEAAMLRLGGSCIGFAEAASSSAAKGESIADTARIVASYADVLVVRHPLAGAARVVAEAADVPVINAGDGTRAHPTQALTDLFLLWRRKERLDGLTVGLCGDLKYGRTVHCLAPVLARLGSRVMCISPPALRMPEVTLRKVVEACGERPREVEHLAEVIGELDALYVTRVQRERFASLAEFERVAGSYVLTPELLSAAPQGMLVMHPLPRVDEIAREVDADPRAAYFEQAAGGVPVRMALIAAVLGLQKLPAGRDLRGRDVPQRVRRPADAGGCPNPRCVLAHEPALVSEAIEIAGDPPLLVCSYCEQPFTQTVLAMETWT